MWGGGGDHFYHPHSDFLHLNFTLSRWDLALCAMFPVGTDEGAVILLSAVPAPIPPLAFSSHKTDALNITVNHTQMYSHIHVQLFSSLSPEADGVASWFVKANTFFPPFPLMFEVQQCHSTNIYDKPFIYFFSLEYIAN